LTWTYLRRGLLAGLLAGVLAGIFAFVFAEPILDRAIALENEHHHEAVFDRGEQKAGLILATALYGLAVGALFGLLAAYFRLRSTLRSEWLRSLALSGAVFLGAVLLPFLKYPPNPPGVGADPATLAERTLAYLAIVVLGLLAVFAAWRFARRLARRLEGVSPLGRELAAGGVLIVLLAFLYLAMPDFGGPRSAEPVPEGLLWEFRLSSLGTQAVLWAAIGGIFGLLGELANRRELL
jgi:predicted cobalt transporter CbtA